MPEVTMPTRLDTLTRTARKIVLGRNDLELLVAAAMSLAAFGYSVGMLLVRLAMFTMLPITALLLYPRARANTRRWFTWAQEQERGRAELIAKLTRACSKPVQWPHEWAEPIPADDLLHAAEEQDRTGAGTLCPHCGGSKLEYPGGFHDGGPCQTCNGIGVIGANSRPGAGR